MKAGYSVRGSRWYQDTTREPIRDETLREGLVTLGAVIMRTDVATTSSRPRFALTRRFAALFDPLLAGAALTHAIAAVGAGNHNTGQVTGISLLCHGAFVFVEY